MGDTGTLIQGIADPSKRLRYGAFGLIAPAPSGGALPRFPGYETSFKTLLDSGSLTRLVRVSGADDGGARVGGELHSFTRKETKS